jgi:hypothetical protein
VTQRRPHSSLWFVLLLLGWCSASACGRGANDEGGDGDLPGDGDGDLPGDGDGDQPGDGDGDGDLPGDGDGDLPGDGDGDAMGGDTGSGGTDLGGLAGMGGEPDQGSGGTEGDGGLDCPLEEYTPTACEGDDDCEEGHGCLRQVCVALCGETIADLEAGLAPGIQPWAHLCGVRRSKQLTYVFEDDGCERAYIYNVNVYRVTAEPNAEIGFGVRRAEIDPSRNLGDQEVVGGTLAPTGEEHEWWGTPTSLISPDGSTIVFETNEAVTHGTTIIRVDTATRELTIGPTIARGAIGAFIENDHLLVSWDADPSATIRLEWGVLSLDDNQVRPLLVADTPLYPEKAVALPGRGALLVSQQPNTVFAVPWGDVLTAVDQGTTINLTANPNVFTFTEPYYMLPVSYSLVGYTDLGSGTSYQNVGDVGSNMLGGDVSEITLANDPTYWGHVTGIDDKRVIVNLFQSVMVLDVP